jgi:colicin import membrane protein
MMNWKKTLIGTTAGALLLIGSAGAALAASPDQVKGAKHETKVEQKAAAQGLTVQQLKDQKAAKKAAKKAAHAQRKAAHQAKLDAIAQSKGISVDQLIAQRKQHHADVLQKAKEQGLTLKQWNEKKKAEHQAKLEAKAAKKGLTVEQLKAKHQAKK